MNIKIFNFGALRATCAVLWEKGPEAFVVDPCFYEDREKEQLYDFFKQQALVPSAILLTHTHFDHTHGVQALSDDFGGLPVYFAAAEQPVIDSLDRQCAFLGLRVPSFNVPARYVEDGMEIAFGDLKAEVIATPGHTPGGVCYLFRDAKILMSGDTLFAGTIGRTDLGHGDYDVLMESILNKLMTLDGDIEVYPGHGESTTIGVERSSNPFLEPFNEPLEEFDGNE
ncbi:MAG: MBL fold metallo-hydrolase [Bacteroidales bacterium]|jgi:glyoxylase-like metal-dependent hydrolase (beta-lactamase superfamily II)|nr:MBL fold metallo-hydrolase [Bacteroidales bacterium]MBQ2452065.1 MBL fold metallo-hydrolase [Bacteroidales bacterium]